MRPMTAWLVSGSVLVVVVPAVALAGADRVGRLSANGTHVSGTINQDTTWTLAGSPYVLDGTVTVASGVRLTIAPGVVVKLNGQLRELRVNGTLTAVGATGSEIVFTSVQDDSVGATRTATAPPRSLPLETGSSSPSPPARPARSGTSGCATAAGAPRITPTAPSQSRARPRG